MMSETKLGKGYDHRFPALEINLKLTMSKAIRAKCLDCSADNTAEVRKCTVFDCPLWPFRMGKYPKTLKTKAPELLDPFKVVKGRV